MNLPVIKKSKGDAYLNSVIGWTINEQHYAAAQAKVGKLVSKHVN